MEEIKAKIFIIEDEKSISKLISMYLEKENMNTSEFQTAEEALEQLKSSNIPDLIILDLNLPGMSGFDFLERFRKDNKKTPVIIVSARDADEDIIQGLGGGADDFVTKPFSPRVLVARVKAALNRHLLLATPAEECINFGEYTLLLNSCVLKKGTKKIPLSTKEYEVLEYIIKNAGVSLSPEKIYNDVWKVPFGDITAVAVYIQRLRKKLESDNSKIEYIRTDFGKGYSFNKSTIK